MIQIGLLTPRSSVFPTINFDLVDGLKASLAEAGITDVEIKTSGIGLGTSDKDIYTAAEKMLFDGAAIIAGYINPSTAQMLEPLFANANAILIVLTPGYHIPPPGYKPQNTFTISLDSTLACRVLPSIAREKGDSEFAFTYSFFDAGFRAPYGFFNGVTDAGAQIVFNHATQLKKKDFTIEPLTNFLKENERTALMAASCGDMVQDLFGAMEAEPEYARHHLYAAPFVAEESWLNKCPYPGANVTAIVSWASTLNDEPNQTFTEGLRKRNRTANLFSLLSWEAGKLVAIALEADGTAERIKLLENCSFTSPRGNVIIDAATHESHAPLYVAAITENEDNGMCRLQVIQEVDATTVSAHRKKFREEVESIGATTTSWYNAYGCLE